MIKKVSIFAFVVAVALIFWFAFALWTGIYSIYSIPPGKEHPKGVTLVVSREEGEPMFNSPDYTEPKKEAPKSRGLGFASSTIGRKRPLVVRTVVELPYVKWAYTKSLEIETPSDTK